MYRFLVIVTGLRISYTTIEENCETYMRSFRVRGRIMQMQALSTRKSKISFSVSLFIVIVIFHFFSIFRIVLLVVYCW